VQFLTARFFYALAEACNEDFYSEQIDDILSLIGH